MSCNTLPVVTWEKKGVIAVSLPVPAESNSHCPLLTTYLRKSAAIFIHSTYLLYDIGCTNGYLMPMYDRQQRDQFRRSSTAGLGKPGGGKCRRYSVDSYSTVHTPNKPPPCIATKNSLHPTYHRQRSSERDGSVSPAPSPAPSPNRTRRSSLGPAQWLNTSMHDMYEKLHDKVSPNRTKDTTGKDIEHSHREGPNHDLDKDQQDTSTSPTTLPDIGLPPGHETLEKGDGSKSAQWRLPGLIIPPIVIEEDNNYEQIIVPPGTTHSPPSEYLPLR